MSSNLKWFDPSVITEPVKESAIAPAAATQQRSGWTIDQIRDFIFKHGDPSAPEPEWRRWIRMIQFETYASPEGLALAIEWSKGGSNFTGEEAVKLKWNSPSWNDPKTPSITIDTLRRENAVAATTEFELVSSAPGEPHLEKPELTRVLAPIVLQRFPVDWDTKPPAERRWITEGYLPAEAATLLISMGGLGKSYLTLHLAICVALGIDFCGRRCNVGRVVIVAGEDPFAEVHRRVYNLARELTTLQFRDPSERVLERVRENIEVVDVRQYRRASGSSPLLTQTTRGGDVSLTPFVGHLAKEIGKANLIIFDTVSRFNGAAARLIDAFEMVGEETSAAVLALAHTGLKGKSGDVDQYSSRGATALSDNARSVLVLAPLPPDMIKQLEDPEQIAKFGRNDLLRLCHTKSNYSRRSEDAYFERCANGVLLPTRLSVCTPETESGLVERLLGRVGTSEVTRNQVREGFVEYFGQGVTREQVIQVFQTAVDTGRLEMARVYRNSTHYRVVKTNISADRDQ